MWRIFVGWNVTTGGATSRAISDYLSDEALLRWFDSRMPPHRSAPLGRQYEIEKHRSATGELIQRFDEISDSDLGTVLAQAEQTWHHYRTTSFAARAE